MDAGETEQWQGLSSDMDLDGQLTLSDLGLWLYHGFFLPGDYVLASLRANAPGVAEWLEVSPVFHGSAQSALVSAAIWTGGIVLVVAMVKLIRDVDRALTAHVAGLYAGFLQFVRIVRRRLALTWRAYVLERRARLAGSSSLEEVDLSDFEIAVLRSHAHLAPGHIATASDIANVLGVRVSQAQKALDKLKRLSLVDSTFGTSDGEGGYRLTRPGAAFLAVCSRAIVAQLKART